MIRSEKSRKPHFGILKNLLSRSTPKYDTPHGFFRLLGSLAPPVRNFTRRRYLGVYTLPNRRISLFSRTFCFRRHGEIEFRSLCFPIGLRLRVNFCSIGARDPFPRPIRIRITFYRRASWAYPASCLPLPSRPGPGVLSESPPSPRQHTETPCEVAVESV